MIDELKIKQKLQTEYIGHNIVCLETVDSTNLLAKRNSQLCEGTLFVADMQTGGRGRLGREWHSQSGDGIYMSLLLKPHISPENISQITLLCALAVADIIENSKIKYPNDIIIGTKKVCGILCESSFDSNSQPVVVCGIGINVNNKSFPRELEDKATSLYLQTKKLHQKEEIIQNFLNRFEVLYKEFEQNGIISLMDIYRKKCINIGSTVRAVYENKEVIGKCINITDNGAVLIKTDNDIVEISSGEVSVRGIYGYI